MSARLNVTFDSDLLEAISSEFDLRKPNRDALRALIFMLDGGDYDPAVMQVLNLATGVGKTYLMAAFIEYLRRQVCRRGRKALKIVGNDLSRVDRRLGGLLRACSSPGCGR